MSNELSGRLFRFAVEVLKLLRSLPGSIEINVIKYQLGKHHHHPDRIMRNLRLLFREQNSMLK
jgi:hypothetical protein